MSKCKTKAIQTDLNIFRNLCNPGILRTVVYPQAYSEPEEYSEPRYIQHACISKIEAHAEPFKTSTMKHFAKIINGYNYFRKS